MNKDIIWAAIRVTYFGSFSIPTSWSHLITKGEKILNVVPVEERCKATNFIFPTCLCLRCNHIATGAPEGYDSPVRHQCGLCQTRKEFIDPCNNSYLVAHVVSAIKHDPKTFYSLTLFSEEFEKLNAPF